VLGFKDKRQLKKLRRKANDGAPTPTSFMGRIFGRQSTALAEADIESGDEEL